MESPLTTTDTLNKWIGADRVPHLLVCNPENYQRRKRTAREASLGRLETWREERDDNAVQYDSRECRMYVLYSCIH